MSRLSDKCDEANRDRRGILNLRPHTVEETLEAINLAEAANDPPESDWVFVVVTIESTRDICERILALEAKT